MTASGRFLPDATGSYGSTSAGQGALRALVKSDANNWSSRMQMTGQWQCKRVVKWNAILQYIGAPGLRPGGFQQEYYWVNAWDVYARE